MQNNTPQWATKILEHQALKHGKYRKMPLLTFKLGRRGSRYWHGHYQPPYGCTPDEIVIFAPNKTKATDTFTFYKGEAILLHEIAHWLVPSKKHYKIYGGNKYVSRREFHSRAFYRKVFRLCKEYNLPYYAYKSEFSYMPRNSKKAFAQIYKCSWL